MLIESHQDCAMTPDSHLSQSRDLSDTASLLRALAAAPDWQAFVAALRLALPRDLPATRFDIYANGPEDETITTLRFSSGPGSAVPPAIVSTESDIRDWLEYEGYSEITTLPLVAAGRAMGWLALARKRGALAPQALALAEQLAPLIALRIRYDCINFALKDSRSYAAALEEQIRVTNTLRIRAILAVGTAHDIGNLFTTVLGHAQILEQDVPTLFQPDVRVIIRAVEDGRQLLGRLQSVNTDPEPDMFAPVALHAIVQDTIKLTQPFWERRAPINVETMFEYSPAVRVSPTDLREVLVNLIMNAVAAMPSGGTITIRCSRSGDRAILSVTDTGTGIARERHSSIFQPLTTTHADGSGLGLSVSRAILERYGGTLMVESAPGQGATFTITLPIS
jgi:signal transduction histidine kinase